ASAERIARRILETGQPEEIDMVGETLKQPGVERCWRESWHPVRDDSDAIIGFSVLVTEIPRLTNAEREIQLLNRQLEERANALQTLLDLVPMAIYLAHDPECRRITGNRAAAELLVSPT